MGTMAMPMTVTQQQLLEGKTCVAAALCRFEMASDVVHQGHLWKVIKQLFPSEDISANSRRVASIKNPETGCYLEVDIYLPAIQLCFEFQDLYHYVTSWYSQVSLEDIQTRDGVVFLTNDEETKNEIVRRGHHTLVTVPCWWDGSMQRYRSEVRPDLIMNFESHQDDSDVLTPIPLNPHMDLLQSMGVPGIGELMLASFPSNRSFSSSISARNAWWTGEKYDGVRCCWNPILHKAYARYGLQLAPLSQLRHWFPDVFIDTEIWFGRGMFSLAQRYVVSSPDHSYCFMRAIAFDIPSSGQASCPFEERYQLLASTVAFAHPFMALAFRFLCVTPKRLALFIKNIIRDGGEGLILNKPHSLYEHGKAQHLIKLKASRGDKEGIVLEVDKVKGVTLKLADGHVITVQPQNVRIADLVVQKDDSALVQKDMALVQKGDIVTFSYDSYSQRSLPVNPVIFRIRTDLSWEQVVVSHLTELPQAQSLNKYSGGEVFTSKPLRYWATGNGKNVREFLISVAKRSGLDALVPTTWYHFPSKIIEEIKGGRTILQYFGGYIKTLLRVFPEIGLDATQFRAYALGKHWDVKKRRTWFSTLAQKRGLDPLVPESWYRIANDKISDPKTQAILRHYAGSFKNALLQLFPEIGLVASHFPRRTIRSFFEEFARRRHMEPLMPDTWYSISRRDFEQDKVGRSIMNQFKGGYTQLIQRVFPEISFHPRVFPTKSTTVHESNNRALEISAHTNCKAGDMVLSFYNHSLIDALHDLFPSAQSTNVWRSMRARRVFFEKFAETHAFEPSNTAIWHQYHEEITRSEKGREILGHYHNDLEKALASVFQYSRMAKSKVSFTTENLEDKDQRQMFFIEFAKRHGFDPFVSENWYSFPFEKILQEKGAGKIMYYYNNNVVKALINLFPNIGLERDKFCYMPLSYWQSKSNRRAYLAVFAAEHALDPHDAGAKGWGEVGEMSCTLCICKSLKNLM